MGIIEHNAARMRELHGRIGETYSRRLRSKEELKEWQEACARFHAEYDGLAFPGGLEAGLANIKAGDAGLAEIAIRYLEQTPYCFRSQYVANALKRALNKVKLPDLLAERFGAWKETKRRIATTRRG